MQHDRIQIAMMIMMRDSKDVLDNQVGAALFDIGSEEDEISVATILPVIKVEKPNKFMIGTEVHTVLLKKQGPIVMSGGGHQPIREFIKGISNN